MSFGSEARRDRVEADFVLRFSRLPVCQETIFVANVDRHFGLSPSSINVRSGIRKQLDISIGNTLVYASAILAELFQSFLVKLRESSMHHTHGNSSLANR